MHLFYSNQLFLMQQSPISVSLPRFAPAGEEWEGVHPPPRPICQTLHAVGERPSLSTAACGVAEGAEEPPHAPKSCRTRQVVGVRLQSEFVSLCTHACCGD